MSLAKLFQVEMRSKDCIMVKFHHTMALLDRDRDLIGWLYISISTGSFGYSTQPSNLTLPGPCQAANKLKHCWLWWWLERCCNGALPEQAGFESWLKSFQISSLGVKLVLNVGF